MKTLIVNLTQYRKVRELYEVWITDITSEEFNTPFHVYWNMRIGSPKMIHNHGYVPYIQLSFDSEEDRTWWLLQNS